MINETNAAVVTGKGAKYEISQSLRDKLAVLSNGNIFVNENYRNDDEVLAKIALFKNIIRDNGQPYSTADQISYVTAEEIRGYYDENQRLSYFADANIIQKSILELISIAYNQKATDIHIVLQAPATYIYFRVLGNLRHYQTLTFDDGNAMCTTLYNTMTTTSGTSYNPRDQQDANISGQFLPEGLSGIRVATGPTQGGNNFMVLRLLATGQNTRLEDLGYAKSHLKILRSCMSTHNGGITLICGPTGSGKSTSLQAMAKEILLAAKGTINFQTIEDPVEYPIVVEDWVETEEFEPVNLSHDAISRQLDGMPPPVNKVIRRQRVSYSARQIAIPSVEDHELKTELYRKTVVAAMRQDPDFMMIGEIRDHSTANAAITASNTGHPVLTTVHARNAQMIIDRLITIGADRNLLLSPKMINGLIAQHLVQELCPNCKQPLLGNEDILALDLIDRLEKAFANAGGLDGICIRNPLVANSCGYYDKASDRSCAGGYIGRFVVAEMIQPDETYLQYMRDGKLLDAYNYWLKQLRGYTMMAHGLAKVKAGSLDPRSLENNLEPITPQINLDIALADGG